MLVFGEILIRRSPNCRDAADRENRPFDTAIEKRFARARPLRVNRNKCCPAALLTRGHDDTKICRGAQTLHFFDTDIFPQHFALGAFVDLEAEEALVVGSIVDPVGDGDSVDPGFHDVALGLDR